MKVLITGAGGQVGRALLRSAPAHLPVVACTHEQLDIADERAVLELIQQHAPNAIINAAAYTNVDQAEREGALAWRINADGPRNLAVAAHKAHARFLHLSTDFVFAGTACIPYKPDSPTNPLNVYGVTKRAGEEAVLRVLPYHSIILRTAWIYAAEGRNFVRTMLRLMQTTGMVRVVADQIGTPTSAPSIAEVIWKIVQSPELQGIYHWTNAGVASWYDFAVAIAEEGAALELVSPNVVVTPITTREYPTPAHRPNFSVLDTSSLASLEILPVHWRKHLRVVLREIKHA
jgi:dTDP-4-dehydrorhamnose reductase